MKRATVSFATSSGTFLYFNPRPREEGDIISTSPDSFSDDFNPRPREEGDPVSHLPSFHTAYFNPRPREEGDITQTAHFPLKTLYFNPRPREEGDAFGRTVRVVRCEFQSTPS